MIREANKDDLKALLQDDAADGLERSEHLAFLREGGV